MEMFGKPTDYPCYKLDNAIIYTKKYTRNIKGFVQFVIYFSNCKINANYFRFNLLIHKVTHDSD
jgi:hypothetical protein